MTIRHFSAVRKSHVVTGIWPISVSIARKHTFLLPKLYRKTMQQSILDFVDFVENGAYSNSGVNGQECDYIPVRMWTTEAKATYNNHKENNMASI
jgi:hypothetical protein